MQFILLFSLLALMIVLASEGMTLPATLIFLLILADFLGGFIGSFFSFIGSFLGGLFDTSKAEYTEFEGAKTKYTSGKKFFEEGITRSAKAVGKGDAARAQGKKIKDERPGPEIITTAISDFMEGLGKVLKK